MIALIMTISILCSCEKKDLQQVDITGTWDLTKTQLYTDNQLTGAVQHDEITTTYVFGNCGTASADGCELIITEDGISTEYQYTFNEISGQLSLNNTHFYTASVTGNQLILDKTYDNYKSVWTFQRGN